MGRLARVAVARQRGHSNLFRSRAVDPVKADSDGADVAVRPTARNIPVPTCRVIPGACGLTEAIRYDRPGVRSGYPSPSR